MIKWAKVCNQETGGCIVGIGTDDEYYRNHGYEQLDVEEAYFGGWYLAGKAPLQPLAELKEKLYHRLWENYKFYQEKYVDAEDLVLASMGSLSGSAKCTAVRDWVMRLWKKYYQRKDQIAAAETAEEAKAVDLTADECGVPAYTIRELNEEFGTDENGENG